MLFLLLLFASRSLISQEQIVLSDYNSSACDDLSGNYNLCDQTRTSTRWGHVEYMMGWITDGPNPIPLVVTTPDPNQPLVIGHNGTSILFGANDIDFGMLQGGRATIGQWLTDDCGLGVEGSGFLMDENGFSDSYFSAPTPNGGNHSSPSPLTSPTQIQAPYFPPAPSNGNSPPTMSILTNSTSRLWGAEVNGISRRYHSSTMTFDTLFGMRHLNLRERITVSADLSQPKGESTSLTEGLDNFATTSEFYGAQLGARLTRNLRRWSLSATGKMALGFNANEVSISGYQTQTDPESSPITKRGFNYTQPSNIGRTTHHDFPVPELQFNTGYKLTKRWSLLAGYNVLFWSDVVRPGDQVDPVINVSQQSGGTLNGDPRPYPLFNRSDLWFQAVTFGTAYRF